MSPIEKAFADEWERYCNNVPALLREHRIGHSRGHYRVDFAHVPSGTIIELDGHSSHSSPDAIAHDRKRERELEQLGWHVIRFGGKEVMRDVHACVEEAFNLITARWEKCSPFTLVQDSNGQLYRTYAPGDRVYHSQFGVGLVLHAGTKKAGVQFHDGKQYVNLEDISIVEAQART